MRNFDYDATMAATLFGQLMDGRLKERPCPEYCPDDVRLLFKRVIMKAYSNGYNDHAGRMEEHLFSLKIQDITGENVRIETLPEIFEWVAEEKRKREKKVNFCEVKVRSCKVCSEKKDLSRD